MHTSRYPVASGDIRSLRIRRAFPCLVLPLALVLGLAAASRGEETAATAEDLMHANSLSKAFRHAAEHAIPSVVVVRSETKAKKVASNRGPQRPNGENPFKGTPFE
ncbi:MAG: hypothetical protein ACKOWG_16480, partial [Planctomycetia bacterium]